MEIRKFHQTDLYCFMAKQSAGILLYRFKDKILEVLLVHPGGPFYKNKDLGVWSVPKGEFGNDEDSLSAAIREFKEETGTFLIGNFLELSPIRQKSGKTVYCWALQGEMDAEHIKSNTIMIEWPMKSGKMQEFPEVDKAAWLSIEEAKKKIIASQIPLLTELSAKVRDGSSPSGL
jgi:predicted NUDIX family NTP pyrophosphohydrolase